MDLSKIIKNIDVVEVLNFKDVDIKEVEHEEVLKNSNGFEQ